MSDAERPNDRQRRLEARLARERRARTEAEQLLEAKSRELYDANLALSGLAADLERRVTERTHELSEARHDALRQAETDGLTGIANRAAFMQRLAATLADAQATATGVAVLVIDLDDFKSVNDSLGHAAGDALLVEVARRLMQTCRPGDTVGRLGGDEFAVLASGVGFLEGVSILAHRLLVAVSRPADIGGRLVPCGCSIGLAEAPPGGAAPGALLGDADLALYASKRSGRGRVTTYEAALRLELERRAVLESEVRQAVVNGCIEPWYQPVWRCAGARFVGAELLARWRLADGSVRAPAAFLETVESLGLLDLMMEKMLRVALREAAPLVSAGQLEYLSINVSAPQFSEGWTVHRLPALLDETGYPPSALVVEITETALLQDLDRSRGHLAALEALGARVAIDDFGVGFSNFSLLRQMCFHKLKLDRSLVCDVEDDERARAVAECILTLAARMNIRTIAEGVETEAQARWLTDAGCDSLQGWLYARAERSLAQWFGGAPRG